MLRNYIGTIALILAVIMLTGCGSSAPTSPVPPTETASPAPVAAGDTWFKTYGGDRSDVCDDVLLADDGGFYLVGTTNLRFEPEMDGDTYLIRTDGAGTVLWEKTYEKEGYQGGQAISRTSDGGLLISGGTMSSSTNGMDVYLLKLDDDGNELWFKTVGGPLDEMAAARQVDDGSYILAGNIVDPDDFVTDPGTAGYGGFEGRSNIYLAKLDAEGNELWSHAYGGENNVLLTKSVQTPDGGGLFLAAILNYPDPDDDIYLLKVDENGQELWARTWAEEAASGYDLVQTTDGGYLFTGPYVPEGSSKEDFLFIKTDTAGNEVWRSTFGDPDMVDFGAVLVEAAGGGYVAAGEWVKDDYSYDSDISMVKIDAQGQLVWQQRIETNAHNMLAKVLQHPDGGYVIASSIWNNNDTFDILLLKTDSQGNVSE